LLPYLFNNRCQSTCPQFYYANLGIGACSLCSSVTGLNCNNCASVSICISCNTGYVLLNQTCLNYVPNGYVNISGVAEPCTGDCSTCSITVTNCTSCINNNLLNNICYIQCPIGYLGLARICQPCTSPCRSCSSTQVTCTSCLTLNPRVYLSNSQCVISCPDGTFANNPNNTCVNCVAPC
jgi:proprotein convertase subtilisin/kexin type 5